MMKGKFKVSLLLALFVGLLVLSFPLFLSVSNAKSFSMGDGPGTWVDQHRADLEQYDHDYGSNMVAYFEAREPGFWSTLTTTGSSVDLFGYPSNVHLWTNQIPHEDNKYYSIVTWSMVNYPADRTNKMTEFGYMCNCDWNGQGYYNPCPLDMNDSKVTEAANNGTFTIEIVLREFKHLEAGTGSTHQDFIFSMQNISKFTDNTSSQIDSGKTYHSTNISFDSNSEFAIYYQDEKLRVKAPGETDGKRVQYTISEAELQNTTITVTVSNGNLNLYLNGKQSNVSGDYCTGTYEKINNYNHIFLGWSQSSARLMHGTYKCIRIHKEAITQEKAKDNFERDKKWFYCQSITGINTAPMGKQELSYGLADCSSKTFDDWISVAKNSGNATVSNDSFKLTGSFYLKSKYKCGEGELKFKTGETLEDLENATRLMATADIKTSSLDSSTKFCGMVIDYSDKVYSLLDSRREEMYFNQPTNYTSPFSTGVGFNLYNNDNNTKMRVFVAGDGYYKPTKYTEITVGPKNEFHNYTIYRGYEKWPYGEHTTYGPLSIAVDSLVYAVRFYADGKLKAIVAMHVDKFLEESDTFEGDSIFRNLQYRGSLFTVNDNGTLEEVSDNSGISTDGKLCTFGDWARENWYGLNGEYSYNDGVTGDQASGSEQNKNDILTNIGTPSGNIFIGMYSGNNNNDVYFDNIGYIDYNSQETRDSYNASVEVCEDMSVHFDTTLHYPTGDVLPKIYFNRLGYDSSGNTYSSLGKTEDSSKKRTDNTVDYKTVYTTNATTEFKAAHGISQSLPKTNGFIASVDGVFFRDVDDTITYDFVDHNGVVIMTKTINLLQDYFKPLYNGEQLTDKQKLFVLDLLDFCAEDSKYSGYFKLKRDNAFPEQNELFGDLTFKTTEELLGIDATERASVNDFNSNTYTKPSVVKTDGINYLNKFKSYNISLKSYISLVVSIQMETGNEDITSCLKIYENYGETGQKGVNLTDGKSDYVDSRFVIDEGEGVKQVKIPLSILNYDKVYTFILTDSNGKTQRLDYSLYKYCSAKWDTTTGGINNYVHALYRLGELAKTYNT